MAPRVADLFKPVPGVSYSKGEVNRGAQLLGRVLNRPPEEIVKDPLLGESRESLIDAMHAVTWWRSLHAIPLRRVAANLRYHVDKERGRVNRRIDVTQRLKRRTTMIGKLEREPTMKLTQMQDIGGVRARLPSLAHIGAVSRRLKKTWTIVKTRDYIAKPKESGYRAIHHIVSRDGCLIEVQLRTVLQDAWANRVEEDGRQLGEGFKFGLGDPNIHDYYAAAASVLAAMDRDELPDDELIQALQGTSRRVRRKLHPGASK